MAPENTLLMRVAVLEDRLRGLDERLEGRLDALEDGMRELQKRMTTVLIVVAVLAGATGAGGKAAVSALLGVPVGGQAHGAPVAMVEER